jgi:large subunit ribosomal protein L15
VKIHDLAPAPGSHRGRKRVARGIGGKGGKTAGRGTKGQKARSKVPAYFEGGQLPLVQRVPKKRGFKNPFRVEYAVVNLDALAALFDAGTVVTPELMREKGLVHGKRALIKVLARGDVSKALTVKAHKFSGKAAEKLAAAGGASEVLEAKARG